MPKRVNQHEIEDISRSKFQLALPRKWVYRDKHRDYGIDGEVELFDDNKNPQGLVFWFQLKATESKEKSTIMNVNLSIETLKYYKTLDIPVLLVRYSDSDNSIYVKWIFNIDLFYAKKNAKTIRIKLSEKDKWNDSTHLQLENYLNKNRQLKSGSFGFPLPLTISINQPIINGLSKGILLAKIIKEIREYSDFITYTTNDDKSLINVSLSNDELKIYVSDIYGCTFHSIYLRDKDSFSNKLAKDILLGISVNLIKLRQVEYAGRIIFENNLDSYLLKNHELLKFCLDPLFKSSYFKRTLNLVGEILDNEEVIDINIITLVNLLIASSLKNEKKNNVVEKFLLKRLEKSINNQDDQQIGISHYNIGNYYSVKNQISKAIHHYNLARKFEPIYLEQSYYFTELANMLFRSKRYKMASKLYLKSIELKKDNHTLALYADSLMFEGEYKKANIAFNSYIQNSENPIEEFILKNICLKTLILEYKIESQSRKEKKANKYADILKQKRGINPIIQLKKALKLDLLSGLAWFNLGITHSNNNNFNKAYFCFTMASLINNEDIEAWKNATLCAFNYRKDYVIFSLIIRTAYFFNHEKYLEALYSHLEEQTGVGSINKIIEMIETIIPEKEDKIDFPTVRILNEKRKFESITEIIEGHNNINI
jgi:tetratricopeptide (TPR) repeat protein